MRLGVARRSWWFIRWLGVREPQRAVGASSVSPPPCTGQLDAFGDKLYSLSRPRSWRDRPEGGAMPTTSKPQVHHSQITNTASVHLNGVKPSVEFVRNDRRCWIEINRSAVLHFACPLEALAFAETLYAAVKTGQPLEPAFSVRKRDRMLEGRM